MSGESEATVETPKQPPSDELEEMRKWNEIEVTFSNYWVNRRFLRYLRECQDKAIPGVTS
jgi:hypothetical protein